MQKIHVNRDRASLGKFTPEEVTAGLRSGQFQPSDLAWQDGMEAWTPLAEFTDLPEAGETITVPPTPGESMELAPEGYGDGGDAAEADGAMAEEIPWERADALGWKAAFGRTFVGALVSPGKMLPGATLTRSLMRPFSYYLLIALVVGLVALVVNVWVSGLMIDFLRNNPELSKDPEVTKILAGYSNEGAAARGLAFLAFGAPLAPFFFAGLAHAFLMSFGAARQSFMTSFSVTCYVLGSVAVFQVIPCCGPFIQLGWLAVSASIGLAAANRVPTWQAAVSVVMTLLIGCGLYVGISALSAAV
jgi:hypothetical protein